MVSVSVLVPEDRLAEFYKLLGDWYAGEPAGPAPRRARLPAPAARPIKRSRYASLTDFLAAFSGDATEMSFEEVEEVLGAPLPVSARRHRAFWANSEKTTQARSWLSAGWVVGRLDWDDQRVRFERGTP